MPIQDAVHGYIHLTELEEDVLDTPPMQRLRRIKQLGFINFVYPCATHTRFEHSLGALTLAGEFADSLGLDDEETRRLRLAALLHDVGHGPFSHVTDALFERYGESHEAFSTRLIADSAVGDVLREAGVDPDAVAAVVQGHSHLSDIVAGHIDVDRMDYLMRDAHYTGVAYGTIESETIIRAASRDGDDLVFDGRYVSALESLLTARYLMITPVYAHRTSKIAAAMFREAVALLQEEQGVGFEDVVRMDDPGIVARLREQDTAGLMQRLDERRLYRIAARLPDTGQEVDALATRLQEEVDLERGELLVDRINFADNRPYDVPIRTGEGVKPLSSVSELPAALQQALQNQSEIRVYTAEKDVDAAQAAVESM